MTEPGPAPAVEAGGEVAEPQEQSFGDAARGLWRDDRIEIVAAILLALAVVLSAWGAYQATRWSGDQANNYAESAALRAESGRHGTIASRQIQIDVQTFIAWSGAVARADREEAVYYRTRFRPEFRTAFDAWLQRPPGTTVSPDQVPAGTPFERPEYVLAEQAKADEALARADAALADAQQSNQISDNFVLTAVLFASVFFFAGTAAKFRPQAIRWFMIAIASIAFVIALVVEFSLPQNVGF